MALFIILKYDVSNIVRFALVAGMRYGQPRGKQSIAVGDSIFGQCGLVIYIRKVCGKLNHWTNHKVENIYADVL